MNTLYQLIKVIILFNWMFVGFFASIIAHGILEWNNPSSYKYLSIVAPLIWVTPLVLYAYGLNLRYNPNKKTT